MHAYAGSYTLFFSFFADSKGDRCQYRMHVKRVIALGYGLLSWFVQLLGSVNPKKWQGWRSQGVIP